MPLGAAVMVGVGPGLGVALVRAFANAGRPVAVLDRDKSRLDTDAAELASNGQAVSSYATDAADPGNLRAAIHAAIAELGAPDVLVYSPTGRGLRTGADASRGDDDLYINEQIPTKPYFP